MHNHKRNHLTIIQGNSKTKSLSQKIGKISEERSFKKRSISLLELNSLKRGLENEGHNCWSY